MAEQDRERPRPDPADPEETPRPAEREETPGRSRRAPRLLADEVAEYDTQARVAATLERIAEGLEKILAVLSRSAEFRRESPRPQFRQRPGGEEPRRDYGYRGEARPGQGYPGPRRDRYGEGRQRPGRPGRRWRREE